MGAAREVGGVESQSRSSPEILSDEAVDALLCMACWGGLVRIVIPHGHDVGYRLSLARRLGGY